MALVRQAWNSFHETLDRYADKRTTNWFLMSSPFYTAAICLTYVYIVKVLGPRLMENRKPLEFRRVLIAYNAFQVVFSAWLFYEMVHASWWYYFSKFTEFFDTFFFVLRKKTQHVSTLHVIHHGIMPFSVWFGVKFTPGGHSTFFGLLNTFVHIIMYSYYFLAALGPQVQKYLWWKKYITALQMAQFVAIMVHAFQLLFTECDYPRAFVWWIGMHAVMFWFLFKEFYDQSYRKPRERAAAKRAADAAAAEAAAVAKENGDGASTNGQSKSQNGVKNGSAHLTAKARAADYYIAAGDLQYRSGAAK